LPFRYADDLHYSFAETMKAAIVHDDGCPLSVIWFAGMNLESYVGTLENTFIQYVYGVRTLYCTVHHSNLMFLDQSSPLFYP
jgi:hypothetical protein